MQCYAGLTLPNASDTSWSDKIAGMTALRTPLRKEVMVSGSRTAYWVYATSTAETGSPALSAVLVHGFRGDHHGLELIAEQLRGATVIVPDLPGFGASTPFHDADEQQAHTIERLGEWLRDFIAATTSGPFILIGHSFGTLVVSSALFAGSQPSEVVLINPISAPALRGPQVVLSKLALAYYTFASRAPHRIGNAVLKHPWIVRVMSEVMAKTKDMQLRAWIHAQHDLYFSTFSDRDSLLDMFRASIGHTVPEFIASYRMPTHIVAAERDDITPISAQLDLHRTLPDSTLAIVPDVGHLIHYEAPEFASGIINAVITSRSSHSVTP